MRRILLVLVLVAVLSGVVGCTNAQQKNAAALRGTWYNDADNASVEFATEKDFVVRSDDGSRAWNGTYELADATHLRISGQQRAPHLYGLMTIVTLDESRLVLTDQNGKQESWVREKDKTVSSIAQAKARQQSQTIEEGRRTHVAKWNDLELKWPSWVDKTVASATKVKFSPEHLSGKQEVTWDWDRKVFRGAGDDKQTEIMRPKAADLVGYDASRTSVPAGTIEISQEANGGGVLVSLGDGYFIHATIYGSAFEAIPDGSKYGKLGRFKTVDAVPEVSADSGRPKYMVTGDQGSGFTRSYLPPYWLAPGGNWPDAADQSPIDPSGTGTFDGSKVKAVPVTYSGSE